MKFLREDMGVATHAIAASICDGLYANKRVLWLVSGGSNIAVEKHVMDIVRNHVGDKLRGLAILPVDERYGPTGHKDSNVQSLRDAGFNNGDAAFIDVLVHDTSFDQTVTFYNEVATTVLSNAGIIIGQFGMGADGHIAGIKPGSPATIVDESTVSGYKWTDYERMTLMPAALRQVTTGYLIAYGVDKKTALKQLMKKTASFQKLPAQLLHELPDVYVYNDQVESED